MIEERAVTQTINLYYDLYVPESSNSDEPKPLLVAFHGYEGNKESMMSLARKINSEDYLIASIQGPNSFFVHPEEPRKPKIGFGWMMQYKAAETIALHHRTLLAVIDQISASHSINRQAIFLIAFSQTVSLSYRFAFTHPSSIKGVISVCGGIPGDWSESKYQNSDTDVLIIAGETDEFYPLERTTTFQPALEQRARSVEFKAFPVGHVFPRESLSMIDAWIKERVNDNR